MCTTSIRKSKPTNDSERFVNALLGINDGAEEAIRSWCKFMPATNVLLNGQAWQTASYTEKRKCIEDGNPSTSTLSSDSPAKIADFNFQHFLGGDVFSSLFLTSVNQGERFRLCWRQNAIKWTFVIVSNVIMCCAVNVAFVLFICYCYSYVLVSAVECLTRY